MQAKIHCYTSAEPMLKVNAFIVEASKELVIVDTTLTMSDSTALKQKAGKLGKPIAAVLLTHGHPDHVAGTYNIAPDDNIPIYALSSVKKLMGQKPRSINSGRHYLATSGYPNGFTPTGW